MASPWYTVRPISARTQFTGQHENSPFTAGWTDTIDLLERELAMLDAEHVVIEVDVVERGIRVDGQLRADARAASPAVRVAFDSRHGPLQYATDRYVRPAWRRGGMTPDWQHNVRAIALGLEALRKVDRYGITRRGEQYAGWKALPPGGGATARPATMTVEEAARLLISMSGAEEVPGDVGNVIHQSGVRTLMFRRAALIAHPDRGGDRARWDELQEARSLLDRHADYGATVGAGGAP